MGGEQKDYRRKERSPEIDSENCIRNLRSGYHGSEVAAVQHPRSFQGGHNISANKAGFPFVCMGNPAFYLAPSIESATRAAIGAKKLLGRVTLYTPGGAGRGNRIATGQLHGLGLFVLLLYC